VVQKSKGSSTAKLLYILIFAAFAGLAIVAFVLWRRGYRVRRRRSF